MALKQTTGSRAQVMHGNAQKTSGGLTKSQLKYNKQGKIVSKKASALAKKNNRLVKAGYVTKKGVFGNRMMTGGRRQRPTANSVIRTFDNNERTHLYKYLAQTTFHPIYEYDVERKEDIEQENIPSNVIVLMSEVKQDVSLILTHKEYNQLFDTKNDNQLFDTKNDTGFFTRCHKHSSKNSNNDCKSAGCEWDSRNVKQKCRKKGSRKTKPDKYTFNYSASIKEAANTAANNLVLLYFEDKSENKIPCFNIKLKSGISPGVTLQQRVQLDWLLDETYSKIINFIKDNLQNNKWLDLFKNWNMRDSIKGQYSIRNGREPDDDQFIPTTSGICYRAGTFSNASLQLQYKLGGLLSPLVLYCYLRAMGESTNNIKQEYHFIYDEGLYSEHNKAFNKRTFDIITLEGHLFTGSGQLPHFYQSSNPVDNLSVVFKYAHISKRRQESSTNTSLKVPYLLRIELSDTLIGMQTTSENDCILPPFIPFDRVRFNQIPDGCNDINCIIDITDQTRMMMRWKKTMARWKKTMAR